jgi:nitrate reductase NapE component
MSENLGSTQPNIKVPATAPNKRARGRTILFSVLGLIVILVVAVLAGYGSGIGIRRNTQSSDLAQQMGEQMIPAIPARSKN